jgi:hypothetical protein
MHVETVKPDLMVHAKGAGSMGGAEGIHVGTVDHMDGEAWIKLKRTDSEDGRHHWIPLSWVDRADEKAIYLTKTADEFRRERANERPMTAQ